VLAVVVLVVSFVMVAAQYGWEFDAVLSGSMEPALAVGGLVVIRPVDAQQMKIGDVISFKLPGIDTPICHRVIDVRESDGGRLFQTQGDANEEPDLNLVPAGAVTGKEVFYLPYVGNLARLAEFGRQRVNILGRGLPVAVLVILPLGLAFIGLTLKDALGEVLHPEEKRRKEALRKRRERFMKQRRAFIKN
jgi:signal peptidase I